MTMGTLDRYIVRNFLSSVGLWMVVLIMLLIMGHLAGNMDEFTENDQMSLWDVVTTMVKYYFYHSFEYVALIGGLVIVAGAAFAVARMNHTNELTAMLASGVSLHRVIWPVILCAIALNVLLICDRELLLPNIRNQLTFAPDNVAGEDKISVYPMDDNNLTCWWATQLEPTEQSIYDAMAIMVDDNFQYLMNVSGEKMTRHTWKGQKGWASNRANLVRERTPGLPPWTHAQTAEQIYSKITPKTLARFGRKQLQQKGQSIASNQRVASVNQVKLFDANYGMTFSAKTFISATADHPARLIDPVFEFTTSGGRVLATIFAPSAEWTTPKNREDRHWRLDDGMLFVESSLTPDEILLRDAGLWLDYMSSSELTDLLQLRNTLNPGEVRLAKYARLADPLNNLIMLFLSLPFVLSRQRNIKLSAGLCLLVVCGYFAATYLCRYIGLPPFWAAFSPGLIMGPISVLMLDNIKT